MTIGIGASGPRAGLAVWRALADVERIASGSIGGFATFATLDESGHCTCHCTQRGGSKTLFTGNDSVLEEPPEGVANAPVAGVISSGPDRPEPLTQFLACRDGVGLVTGHRLPNTPSVDGDALNSITLDRIEAGASPATAISEVTEANPQADAGLIAVDCDGAVAAANTEKVDSRPDVSSARRSRDGCTIEVLNNSITPGKEVTELASAAGLSVMADNTGPDFRIRLSAGIEAEHAAENRVLVDNEDEAISIQTTDERLLQGERNGAVPYLGSTVIREAGGDQVRLGETISEVNTVLRDGIVASLSGQQQVCLGVRNDQ